MDLRYIDSFLAVTKYSNFSDAANFLYISQSSLSKNIKKLETEMNVKLFNRTKTGVSLTNYGKIYMKYALKIKDFESRCDNLILDEKQKGKQSKLIIGTIPSASEYGILNLILDYTKKTGVSCQIINDTSSHLEKKLFEGQLDLAFIKNPENNKISKINYKDDQLVVVVASKDPLAKQKKLNIKDLKSYDFILEPVNSRPYQLCIYLCKKAGFKPSVIYSDRFVDNIINFVSKGVGVSLLMKKLVPKNLDTVTIVPIDPVISAKINLCFLKNEKNKFFKKDFIEFVKAY